MLSLSLSDHDSAADARPSIELCGPVDTIIAAVLSLRLSVPGGDPGISPRDSPRLVRLTRRRLSVGLGLLPQRSIPWSSHFS